MLLRLTREHDFLRASVHWAEGPPERWSEITFAEQSHAVLGVRFNAKSVLDAVCEDSEGGLAQLCAAVGDLESL